MKAKLRTAVRCRDFWLALGFIILTQLLAVGPAALTQRILDGATAGNLRTIVVCVGAYVGIACGIVATDYLSQLYQSIFITRISAQMRSQLVEALLSRNISDFQRHPVSRYQNVFDSEISAVVDDFYQPLLQFIQGCFGLLFNLALLTYLDPVLMMLTFGLSALPLLVPFRFGQRIAQLQQPYLAAQSERHRQFQNILHGFAIVQNFRAQMGFRRAFAQATTRYTETSRTLNRTIAGSNALGGVAFYVSTVVILAAGAWRAYAGLITIGGIAAVLQINESLVYPIQLIADRLKQMLGARLVIQTVDQFLAPSTVSVSAAATTGSAAAIVLQDVGYVVADTPVLQAVSLRLTIGKHYLVVGESGAGKSTLLHLIKGSAIPTTGRVTLPVNLAADRIQLVDQTQFVFETTVGHNVDLMAPAHGTSVEQALAQVNLKVDLKAPPTGMSDGEKQRLAIARGLYFASDVLLLDEVTSALDQRNRHLIERRLRDYPGTLISVVHHIDAADRAYYDAVIEVRAGRIQSVTML